MQGRCSPRHKKIIPQTFFLGGKEMVVAVLVGGVGEGWKEREATFSGDEAERTPGSVCAGRYPRLRRQCLTSGTQPPDQWLRHRMAADISGIVREKRPREMYCHVKLSQKSERENNHATSPVFQRGRSTQNLSGTRRKLPTNPLSDSLPPFGKSQEALDRMCIAYVVRSFQPGLYHCPTHPIPHSLTPEGVSSGFRRVPEPKGSEHKVCLFFSRLDSSARGRGSRQGALSSTSGGALCVAARVAGVGVGFARTRRVAAAAAASAA